MWQTVFKKFDVICSVRSATTDNITSNFFFYKFYTVHSWITCLKSTSEMLAPLLIDQKYTSKICERNTRMIANLRRKETLDCWWFLAKDSNLFVNYYTDFERIYLDTPKLIEGKVKTTTIYGSHSMHTPHLSEGGGGGGWASNQIFKKGGLDRTSTFRGGFLWKKVGWLFSGGLQLSHKK